ncbi:esterase E4-like [Bombyx mandarina]|uniref:Esterase E4-like n=1 Tax=Bombyx mandarina TaxID=7092 RepID=A0A6J2JAE0_BOMMA|nr:esterase E4-like [Bombyx mandarina]
MTRKYNCLFFYFFVLNAPKHVYTEDVEVKLGNGVLLGKIEKSLLKENDFLAFRGIPYGEAPVGKLRFKPPVPHKGWEGTYEAYVEKPTCLQFSSRMRNGEEFGISGSEDCLFINIFTPSLKGSAPVVVFDYNDNFRTGFNGSLTYAPDFFVEEGVVVVTISHRLGLLGYLTTEDDVIPGNNGLRDFLLGLQWIQDNIKSFGGDASRVSVMGNRGGAAIAETLLYSKKAKGLFSAVMIQSGTTLEAMYFYRTPKAKAFEFGRVLKIETDDSEVLLEGLQKVEAGELLRNEIGVLDNDEFENDQHSTFPFAPTIEPENPEAVITNLPENGHIVNDVPVLIGFNSREGLDLTSHFLAMPQLVSHQIEENIVQFPIRQNYRFVNGDKAYKEAAKDILEFYFEDKSVHYGNVMEYTVYAGDVLQMYALQKAVTKLSAELQSNLYFYMFDFLGEFNENSYHISRFSRYKTENHGATIGDELCYLHLCNRIRNTYKQILKLPNVLQDVKLLKKMVRLWTNFAKSRNPTPSKDDTVLNGLIWNPVVKEANVLNYLHITKKPRMSVDPLGDRAKFWDNFLDKYSKMAVDGIVKAKETKDEL